MTNAAALRWPGSMSSWRISKSGARRLPADRGREADSARVQAVAVAQDALHMVRALTSEVLGDLYTPAQRTIGDLLNALPPGLRAETDAMDADAREELRLTAAMLLGDLLTVGRLDGVDPAVWPADVLPHLALSAARATLAEPALHGDAPA